MLNHIKKLSFVLTIILSLSIMIVAATPAMAISQSKENLINSVKLAPVKTGYRPLDKAVDDVLGKITNDNMSAYQKIKAVYDYMIINYAGGTGSFSGKKAPTSPDIKVNRSLGQKPSYSSSTDSNIVDRALTIIESHRGTCLHYSSAFVVFARALGFESYRIYGKTAMAAGGMGEHYWPIIVINGQNYVFDAQVDDHIAGGGSIKYWRFCLDNNESRGLFSLASPINGQIKGHNSFDMPSTANVKVKGLSVSPKTLVENTEAQLKFELSNPDDIDLVYSYYYIKGLEEPAKKGQNWQAIDVNSEKDSVSWTLPDEGIFTVKANIKQKDSSSNIYSKTLVLESKKDEKISLGVNSTAIFLGSPLKLNIKTFTGIGNNLLYDFSYTYENSKKQNFIAKDVSKDKLNFTPEIPGKYIFNASVNNGMKTFSSEPVSVFVVEDYLNGDYNLDGKISAKDARLALLASVRLIEANEVQKKAADVNNDGRITAADARLILRAASGLEKIN